MQPSHKFLDLHSLRFSYYEWGNAGDPTLLFVHATGMNGRIWDQTISALQGRYHIIAIDQRGHGQSQSSDYLLDWALMGNDLCEVIEQLKLQAIIGVGHSMGGHVLVQAALSLADRFKRLVLIDPVIFEPSKYDTITEFEKGHPKDNPIARRRNTFASWEEMNEIFSKKPPFSKWEPAVLRDYCRYGTVPGSEGGTVSLACAPDIEASVYMGHHSVNLEGRLGEILQPVTVLRARGRDPMAQHQIDFSTSPTWDRLAACFANGQDVWLQHLSHFIPMEDPTLTARHIEGNS